VLVFGVVVFFLLQLIPRRLRKRVVVGCTFVAGFYYLLGWVLPAENRYIFFFTQDHKNIFSTLEETVGDIVAIIYAFTIGLGLINLCQIHGRSIVRRRAGWHNSLAFFVALIAMAVFSLLDRYRPPLSSFHPSWSPDGRIVVSASREAGSSLYILTPDGRETRLPGPPKDAEGSPQGEDIQPSWSPDGKWIAFISTRDGNNELYVMSADGSGIRRLTRSPENESHPAWTPDSRRIVFASNNEKHHALQAIGPDGTGAGILWEAPSEVDSPTVSPDGRQIAFAMMDHNALAIFALGIDGSDLKRISPAGGMADDTSPAWSPDGRSIAFVSNRGEIGAKEVWLIGSDGRNLRSLTKRRYREHEDVSPAWAKDGRKLAFISNRDDLPLVYTINADRSEERRLSPYPVLWEINRVLFLGMLNSLDATMFSLLAFYIAAAAYRAFRVRSIEAILLMGAAFVVMLGQVPFGMALTARLPTEGLLASFRIEVISNWILQTINTPAYRAMNFGLALGGLAMALRIWLSLERGSYFEREL